MGRFSLCPDFIYLLIISLNKTSGMKGFDRLFVKLSFMTYLKSGAYTEAGFEELIAQTAFTNQKIEKRGIGFEVWMLKFVSMI